MITDYVRSFSWYLSNWFVVRSFEDALFFRVLCGPPKILLQIVCLRSISHKWKCFWLLPFHMWNQICFPRPCATSTVTDFHSHDISMFFIIHLPSRQRIASSSASGYVEFNTPSLQLRSDPARERDAATTYNEKSRLRFPAMTEINEPFEAAVFDNRHMKCIREKRREEKKRNPIDISFGTDFLSAYIVIHVPLIRRRTIL